MTEKPAHRPSTAYPVVFGLGLLGFLMGVLGNLVAAWIQQDVLVNSFAPITVVSIVVLTFVGLSDWCSSSTPSG